MASPRIDAGVPRPPLTRLFVTLTSEEADALVQAVATYDAAALRALAKIQTALAGSR